MLKQCEHSHPFGSLGRLVGPSPGEVVDQETFVSSGVQGAAPLGLPPPLGERGGHHHYYHIWFPNNIGLRISTELISRNQN